jgi:plastocyanin/cytochrome c553
VASLPPLRWLALLGAAGAALGLAACGSVAAREPTPDNIASGKQKYAVCSSCHALADANAPGQAVVENVPVPNFDDAFRALREQGFKESSIRGLIMGWIDLAELPMPRGLLKGQDAYDVAAYIASVAGKAPATPQKALPPEATAPVGESPQTPGSRPPELNAPPPASTGAAPPPVATTGGPAPAPPSTGGETVPVKADPGGQLAFIRTKLTAKAGKVTLELTNPSPVPHNIAVKGNGVNAGPSPTVEGGATASLTVTLKPGTYEFYCAVPGHEEGGMKGTLTVR